MKTAMQILSKYIDEMQERYITLSKNDKKLQTRVNAILTATTLIKMQINDWGIEKEKEQIMNAYNDGVNDGNTQGLEGREGNGNYATLEEYYNQTYNQMPELRNADGTYGIWGTSGNNNQNK